MDFSFLCTDDLNHTLVAGCLGTPGISHTYLDTLLDGFKNTAILSIYSLILAVFVGVIIGMIRTLPKTSIINSFLRAIGAFWVETMRNIPLLVQVFLWYFVVPKIYPPAMNFPPILLITCALGFFTSARIAEQIRSGIESIPSGQRYAAMAMGFNTYQSYRYIILPRAIRTIMPPLTSEAMGIVKNSSIAFAVSINELMQFQYQTIEEVSHVYENYLLVTILYILISLFIFVIMTIIERIIKIPCFQKRGALTMVIEFINSYSPFNFSEFDFSFFTFDIFCSYILSGLLFSVFLTIVTTVFGLIFGILLAMMRLSSVKLLSTLSIIYITAMRSIPLVMVILWFFVLLPFITGTSIGANKSALITFTAFEAAYFAEIMRAGILSISQGQKQAGQALGMTYWQNMRIVILPQAFRNMLPVFLTQIIILFQDTTLVYAISGNSLLNGFDIVSNNFGVKQEAYILAAIFYFVICFTLSQIVLLLQKKISIIR